MRGNGIKPIVESSLQKHNIEYSFIPICHQCRYILFEWITYSWEGIQRVCDAAKEMKHCDFVIAVGGGKAVDLGKGVATVKNGISVNL